MQEGNAISNNFFSLQREHFDPKRYKDIDIEGIYEHARTQLSSLKEKNKPSCWKKLFNYEQKKYEAIKSANEKIACKDTNLSDKEKLNKVKDSASTILSTLDKKEFKKRIHGDKDVKNLIVLMKKVNQIEKFHESINSWKEGEIKNIKKKKEIELKGIDDQKEKELENISNDDDNKEERINEINNKVEEKKKKVESNHELENKKIEQTANILKSYFVFGDELFQTNLDFESNLTLKPDLGIGSQDDEMDLSKKLSEELGRYISDAGYLELCSENNLHSDPDLFVNFQLKALYEAMNEHKKNQQILQKPKLSVAVEGYMKFASAIHNFRIALACINSAIAVFAPALSHLQPIFSHIFGMLSVIVYAPRLLINLGLSLYYYRKEGNWNYFNDKKFEILNDALWIACNLVSAMLTTTTFGAGLVLHPAVMGAIANAVIMTVGCMIDLGSNLYQQYRSDKDIDKKLQIINDRLEKLGKNENSKGHKALLYLKEKLESEKLEKNKAYNGTTFMILGVTLAISPLLWLPVGATRPSIAATEIVNWLPAFAFSGLSIYLASSRARALVARKFDAVVSIFRGRPQLIATNALLSAETGTE